MRSQHMRSLSVLAAAVVMTGCASVSQEGSRNTVEPPRYVAKESPALTPAERTLLINNGYAIGIWAESCGAETGLQERYFEERDKFMSETRVNGTVVRLSALYEVAQVSTGVVRLKAQGQDMKTGQHFIAQMKTGFSANKKMTFDRSVLFLSGNRAGQEVAEVKDGFEMVSKDGSSAKGAKAPVLNRCK